MFAPSRGGRACTHSDAAQETEMQGGKEAGSVPGN